MALKILAAGDDTSVVSDLTGDKKTLFFAYGFSDSLSGSSLQEKVISMGEAVKDVSFQTIAFDVEQLPRLTTALNIKNVPTVSMVVNGIHKSDVIGVISDEQLMAWIQSGGVIPWDDFKY